MPTFDQLSAFTLALIDKVGVAGVVLLAIAITVLAVVWFGSKKIGEIVGPLFNRAVSALETTAEATTANTVILKDMHAASITSATDHKDHDKVARDGRDAAQEGAATGKAILDMLKKDHAA